MNIIEPEKLPAGPKRVYIQALAGSFDVEALQGGSKSRGDAWVVRGKKGPVSFSGLWTQEPGKGVKNISLWFTDSTGALQQCKLTTLRSFLEKS